MAEYPSPRFSPVGQPVFRQPAREELLKAMARDPNPLVFSTDGSHQNTCPTCGVDPCGCAPASQIDPSSTLLRMRLDRKNRRGKAVTVVYDLPANPEYFTQLAKKLKAHCGTGGGLKNGDMEIQGDQRDRVQEFLEKLGFTVRRSGG